MITFNVVFTPGSPRRLVPFATSLLRGTGVRVRLVANGCGADDVEVLRDAAEKDERLSCHVLPGAEPVEHGLALNDLFEAFPEPYFATADSDVLASGDFMAGLWPMQSGQAAVFSAPPVWLTSEDVVASPRITFLSGRHRVLPDGTPIGSTYLAIYDRAAVEPVWRAAPRGFAEHRRHMLSRSVRQDLAARGWDFRALDTCRLVNLQLLLAGFSLEDRPVRELHHVGGFSVVDRGFESRRETLRRVPGILRSKDEPRLARIADALAIRLDARRRHRDPRNGRIGERRRIVVSHVRAVIDAMTAGAPVPPAPRTDSQEVDGRVAALTAALEAHYYATGAKVGSGGVASGPAGNGAPPSGSPA